MTLPSQTDRVLAVLRERPVTISDFDRQPACDGLAKITRLAARIQDLKAAGCTISSRKVTLGGAQVAEYTLLSAPEHLGIRSTPGHYGEGGEAIASQIVHHASESMEKVEVSAVRCPLPDDELSRPPLPGVVPVRAHLRRIHSDEPPEQLVLEVAA